MTTLPAPSRLAYSVAEAATAMGLGASKTWELVRSGELASVRVDRRVLVTVSAIEDYFARKTAGGD